MPLYSKFSLTLDNFMSMKMYETLVIRDGMTFQKMIRIVTIGMIKPLSKLSKEKPHNIKSLEMNVFHQLILCSQEAKSINEKGYKGPTIYKVQGASVIRFR